MNCNFQKLNYIKYQQKKIKYTNQGLNSSFSEFFEINNGIVCKLHIITTIFRLHMIIL